MQRRPETPLQMNLSDLYQVNEYLPSPNLDKELGYEFGRVAAVS